MKIESLFGTETLEKRQHFVPHCKDIADSSCAEIAYLLLPWWKCSRISVVRSKTRALPGTPVTAGLQTCYSLNCITEL